MFFFSSRPGCRPGCRTSSPGNSVPFSPISGKRKGDLGQSPSPQACKSPAITLKPSHSGENGLSSRASLVEFRLSARLSEGESQRSASSGLHKALACCWRSRSQQLSAALSFSAESQRGFLSVCLCLQGFQELCSRVVPGGVDNTIQHILLVCLIGVARIFVETTNANEFRINK